MPFVSIGKTVLDSEWSDRIGFVYKSFIKTFKYFVYNLFYFVGFVSSATV